MPGPAHAPVPRRDPAPWTWQPPHFAVVIGVLYVAYQLANRWHWRPPSFLLLTALDRAIPLLEWTVWPYLLLAGCMGLIGLVRDPALYARAVRALLLAYPINLVIFMLWPTTYPRVEFVPGTGLNHAAFGFLFAIDTPASCFPSGHITAPFIGFWAVARENPRWRFGIWGAFALLCPTILTTKQHYAVDLLGGLAIGLFGVWASGRNVESMGPGRRPLPRPFFDWGIVNIAGLHRDPLQFLGRLTAQCGTVAACRFAWLTRLFVNEPALARAILELPHAGADKATRSVSAITRITGESVLTTNGQTWARLRRMVQPAFHRRQVERQVEAMGAIVGPMLDDWRQAAVANRPLEVGREMRRLTFRFTCKALFSIDPSAEIAQLEQWITTAMDETWRSIQSPTDYALRLPTRRRVRFRAAMAGIDGFVARLIATRRATGGGDDLLGMLLAVREADGTGGLSDEEIRNECVTLMIAGYDTTANALTWALLEIARRPGLAAELREELTAALGDRPPTLADLPQLRLTRAVFLETLRLYPPIWILERNLQAPVEAGGWYLPAGRQVLISPWIMHRLPAFWARPVDFEPRRFLGEPAAGEENPAFLPFGAGSRGCIGKPLAMLEGQVFLAAIVQAGTPTLADNAKIESEAGVSLRPRRDVRIGFSCSRPR